MKIHKCDLRGQSGINSISENCGNKNSCVKQSKKKTNNEKMSYDELRHKIHDILGDFFVPRNRNL